MLPQMLRMCGLPDMAGDESFPKWFREIFRRHMNTIIKAHLIATAIEKSFIIDDAEVPLYPTLTKTITVRDWTVSYSEGGQHGSMPQKVQSPFAMVDLTKDDIADMTQEFNDLQNTTAVTTANYKAVRAILAAKMPGDVEGFMVMLKGLQTFYKPYSQVSLRSIYKCLELCKDYGITLRDYSPRLLSERKIKTFA